jgi:hypothetical protein
MALLTALTRLTWLTRTLGAGDPLYGDPIEYKTSDGLYFRTADGVYFGVPN